MCFVQTHSARQSLCKVSTCCAARMALDWKVCWSIFSQAVYPWANASVPVTVTGGRILAPAAVDYVVAPQTPAAQPFLPSVNGSVAGTLRLDPAQGGSTGLAVPIEWSQVGRLPSRPFLVHVIALNMPHAVAPRARRGPSCGRRRVLTVTKRC